MRGSNYLIFYQPYWTSINHDRVWIKRDVKLYFTKLGMPDKRTKEYRDLLKTRPNSNYWMGGGVKIADPVTTEG